MKIFAIPVLAALVLGSAALTTPASALPITAPSAVSSQEHLVQVRMTRHQMMMHRRMMMRNSMRHKRMMHHKRMMRHNRMM